MGRDIPNATFSDADFQEFKRRLRQESMLLKEWFETDSLDHSKDMCGFEQEMWLLDGNYLPAPFNEKFLQGVSNPLVVPELSKFNFEINSTPHPLEGPLLNRLESELSGVWDRCEKAAAEMGLNIMSIGILPTVRNEMLTLDNMSSLKRYVALNQQVLRLRDGKPLDIRISGEEDLLHVVHRDVMVEAAATSLQIHLQVNAREAVRHYNLSQILSAPMVAVAANSPFLFGKDLWAETRIPTFEQSVSVASFRDSDGNVVGRVTFGTGYGRETILEPFLENLDAFPILLPLVFDEDPTWLSHLRLHNGTIWRWNRPLIGLDDRGRAHVRIEHRVPSAGPSIVDTVANIAFFLGLINFFVNRGPDLQCGISFQESRENFYRAARFGMDAHIRWADGREHHLQTLLLEELVPAAREGLLDAGLLEKDICYYLDKVIFPRIKSGQNGAVWQRAFAQKADYNFQELTHAYFERQQKNIPVHEWTV